MAGYQIWVWGNNEYGQLGTGNETNYSSPVSIARPGSYSMVNAGHWYSLAIDSDGMIWTWGRNHKGQLGTGNDTNYSSPVSIARLGSYADVANGRGCSLAIDASDGTIWVWGNNEYGKLGTGNGTDYSSPVSIARLGSYSRVNAGHWHSLAIDGSDGSIWGWGANDDGKLGTNDTSNQSSPVSIARSGSYTAVDGGAWHSLAIDGSDGSIWGWGANGYGQLGTNDTSNQFSPVSIARSGSYKAISVGDAHSLAIDGSDGMVWAWGRNNACQLGNNDTSDRSSPVSIARVGSYVAISSRDWHSLAIDSDGIVWGWGNNEYGQLGTGNATNYSSPVSIARVGSYSMVSAGNRHSLAIEGSFPEPPTPPSPAEDNDSPRDFIGMHNEFGNSPGVGGSNQLRDANMGYSRGDAVDNSESENNIEDNQDFKKYYSAQNPVSDFRYPEGRSSRHRF